MKTIRSSRYFAIVAMLVLLLTRLSATTYLAGISPNYTQADAQSVLQTILLFVLEGASPDDRLVIYDALNQAPVATFTIPGEGLFRGNPRARAQRLKSEIAALQKFLNTERSFPPEMRAVIHVPEFLDLAGAQLRFNGEPVRVILIGSPFYMNSDDPAFNMNDAYPSDATLSVDQRQSAWGTALRQRTLTDVVVHYAYLRECFVNDFHKERTGRFLSLYIRLQQGVLATFAPDVSLAFQRAKANIQQPFIDAQLDANDTKLEMRHITPRTIPGWFGATNTKVFQPSEVSTKTTIAAPEAVSFPVAPLTNKIGIGIKWAAPVDCDLYVRASPSARELSFRNVKGREGRYFHDYRNGNVAEDYEYVELDSPTVDLREVTAFVNLFGGRAASVSGTVIVYYEGKTYYGGFQLAATVGNSGRDGEARDRSPHWTKLDLMRIVGLPDAAPSNEHRL